QAEPVFFPAGAAGAKSLTFSMETLSGEENLANNTMTRPIVVSDAKRRILYLEGEPRWEYKFIRRAEAEDPTVQLVSMLRTSRNDLLPTILPQGKNNFHRNAATVELTAQGLNSPITQLLDDPAKNAQRWKKLTYLADYEDAGAPKPGATVLADLRAGRRKLPL